MQEGRWGGEEALGDRRPGGQAVVASPFTPRYPFSPIGPSSPFSPLMSFIPGRMMGGGPGGPGSPRLPEKEQNIAFAVPVGQAGGHGKKASWPGLSSQT